MKSTRSTRLLETVSSSSVCLFCAHRLPNPAAGRIARAPRRHFVRTAWPRQHAGQAAVTGSSFPDGDPGSSSSPQGNYRGRDAQRRDSSAARSSRDGTATKFRLIKFESGTLEGEEQMTNSQWGHLRRRPVQGSQARDDTFAPHPAGRAGRSQTQQFDPQSRWQRQDGQYSQDFDSRRGSTQLRFVALRQQEQGNAQSMTGPGGTFQRGERDWAPSTYDPRSRSNRLTDQSQLLRKFEPESAESSDRQPQQQGWKEDPITVDPGVFVAPAAYDDSPRRRARDQKPRATDRRAEKFDFSGDSQTDTRNDLKARREQKKQRRKEKAEAARETQEKSIELPEFISVANLATALKVRVESFAEKLEELGFEDVANDHVLNFENASLVAMEYDYRPMADRSSVQDLKPRPFLEDMSSLPQRPPVVTIMGHVDHGKTTLLDFLRKSSVAAQEHGGITQHIGAFSVQMSSGKLITFLDTPGHAAFLNMRQRGANVTDIVILVVAADDSVKPQTIEAIKHAKAAKVPIIVAINKVDKDEADIERVKQDLLRHEIEVEDYGGDVQAYPVSGKTGQGLDDLVEAITTQAEILDVRAETDGLAEGWVLEAATTKAGRTATVLVKRGTLRVGDIIVAGTTWARVRTLKNEAGIQVHEASPGTPVEVDGWRNQPIAGDEVLQAPSEQKASSVAHYRNSLLEQTQAAKDMEAINENRRIEMERREREKEEREAAKNDINESPPSPFLAIKNTDATQTRTGTDLYFIIKADVSGSAEAIESSVAAIPLSNHPVNLNILRSAVGPVSEFDVDHASAVPAGHGFIVSFNQAISPQISAAAETAGVRILDQNIIYKIIDDVRGIVEAKLPPLITKLVLGEAEVAQTFEINTGRRKFVKVAGCKVRNGVVTKGNKIRVYRGNVGDERSLVHDGTMMTLKSQKKDVLEMRKGTECGMGFDNWEDFLPGDVIQCYEEKSEPRRLM